MLISFFLVTTFLLSLLFLLASPEVGLVRKLVSPFGLFLLFYSFVFYLVPFFQVLNSVGRFQHLVSGENEHLMYSTVIALLYQSIVVLFFSLYGRSKVNFNKLSNAALNFDSQSKRTLIVLLILCAFGMFMVLQIIMQYWGNFAYFMYDRINILSGYGYFIKMLAFSTSILVLVYLKNNGNAKALSLWLIFFVTGVVFILLGSRTNAVIGIPYLILAYLLVKPDERLSATVMLKLVGLFLALLVLVSSLSLVREAMKEDGLESVKAMTYEDSSLSKEVTSELYKNYGHNELLALVIERESLYEKAYGYTFLAGFVSFVPRSLWHGKPVGGGPMLANIVAPGAYKLGSKEGNSSLTTGLIIEGYLNFGIIGVMLMGLLHGLFLAGVTRFSNKVKNSVDFMIYLILFHYFGIVFITGEFLGVFSSLLFSVIPLYFISKLNFKAT